MTRIIGKIQIQETPHKSKSGESVTKFINESGIRGWRLTFGDPGTGSYLLEFNGYDCSDGIATVLENMGRIFKYVKQHVGTSKIEDGPLRFKDGDYRGVVWMCRNRAVADGLDAGYSPPRHRLLVLECSTLRARELIPDLYLTLSLSSDKVDALMLALADLELSELEYARLNSCTVLLYAETRTPAVFAELTKACERAANL